MTFEVANILSNLTAETAIFLPNLVAAIILLLIGLVLGKIIGRVVYEVLQKVRLDYYVTEQKKPTVQLSSLFALITRWWIYLAFISAALSNQVLGIPSLASWVTRITDFIPSIIGASAIIVVAFVLAEYIKNHIKASSASMYATIAGKALFFFVMYVAIALALPVLGLPAGLVNNILLVIIGSVGLGIAIAMGLGMKDGISDLSKRYAKKVKV